MMGKMTTEQCDLITSAYKVHGRLINQIARKFSSSHGSRVDFGDISSYLNEKFMEAVLRYDSTKNGNMGAYINTRLTQHALNFIKSSYQRYYDITDTFSALNYNTFEGDDEQTFEETMLSNMVKLEDEYFETTEVKRTIATLYEQATPLQRNIMDIYLKTDVKPSFTQVGKALGIHHMTVKRELEKLSKLVEFDFSVLS